MDWEHLKLAFAVVGIILLIVLFVVVKGRFDSRNHDDRNFSVSEKGTYGTAAYLSEKQAKRLLTSDNEHSLLAVSRIFGSENGIILGTFPNGHIVTKRAIPKENLNMFVCGAPGSGKSYMFVRPFITQCIRRKESFVCTDPSGELLETMGGYAKACGYKVKVFNLVDPEKSDSWNVTGEVGINQMHAQIAVSTIIKNTLEGERPDPFWDNGEKNLLKALLLYIDSDAYTGTLVEVMETTTDDDGNTTTKGTGRYELYNIEKGKYIVVETKTPVGYVDEHKEFPFEITDDQQTIQIYEPVETEIAVDAAFVANISADTQDYITDTSGDFIEITDPDEKYVFNTPIYGDVYLRKIDAENAMRLSGAVFRVWADSNNDGKLNRQTDESIGVMKEIKDADGKGTGEYEMTGLPYDSNGNAVDTLKEVSEGVYELDGLTVGNYTLKEIKAPVGFLLDTNAYNFSIVNDGNVISIETKAGIGFINTPIKGTISVVKVDEKTRKPLSGAEFTIYDSNGNPVKTTTTETGTVITDANGVADFGELRYGTYIVKESKAPENYELDDAPIPFQVLENGKVIEYEKGDPAEEGKLEIIKQSEDGVIENVKFRIYGTSANGTDIDETVLTDKDGKFLIENLLIGTYTVEELEIADRYIKTTPKTVVVSANETASVNFENILKRGKVITTKVDEEYPDNKLTGAIFEVYDSEGQLVDTLKEVSEDVYELDGLTVGNYTLKETKTPDGFDLDENAYPFEITENGDVRNIETLAGVGFINNPQKGNLVISKRSSDKKLEGFSFRITGKAVTGQEYDQIFKTDAEGKITVKDLRVGTYTVSEISDETNVRYNLPDDQTVEIKSKEVTEVEMYNDEKVIPFEITKSDISTGELIPGCGFRIRNSDGEIVIEGYTDENGIAKFELIGVDAGIRSAAATVGAVYAAGKIAHSAGKGAVKIGKGVGEFGKDVATKGAAIGRFAAGAGVQGAKALKSAKSGINTPKDQKQDEKSKKKDEKPKAKAADRSDKSQENRNDAIGRQVAADTSGKMKSDPSYSSDNIEAYEDAVKSIPQGAGKSDAQITDMAEDAYIHTHGDQLVDEAAEIRDEAAANGTDMSEKDALTSAFAGKHKDSSAVSSDGTYRGATQGAKNKIDNLQQSQKAQGRSVDSARLSNYSKIAGNARKHQNSEQFRNLPEVQAHTAAAAEMHGRSYDPSSPGTAERVDAYQGNMSTALEIMSHAQDYIAEQKQAGNTKVTEEQAIAHVVANEEDYDMSYGFDRSYSTDIAGTLTASDKVQSSQPASDASARNERSRSITGNSSVNQNLGREKQSHDKPRPSVIGSAKGGYDAARSIFGKKKK